MSLSVGEFIALFAFCNTALGAVIACTAVIVTNKVKVKTLNEELNAYKVELRVELDKIWVKVDTKVDK